MSYFVEKYLYYILLQQQSARGFLHPLHRYLRQQMRTIFPLREQVYEDITRYYLVLVSISAKVTKQSCSLMGLCKKMNVLTNCTEDRAFSNVVCEKDSTK